MGAPTGGLGDQLRGYEVTLVTRNPKDDELAPPLELPEGITATIEGPEIVFVVPVRAYDARSALAQASAIVTDFLFVLAASATFGYETVIDQRQTTRRTDAVYQAEGPPPPFDVAVGSITEAGAELLDPTGEARRAGRVLTLRVPATVIHPVAAEIPRFTARHSWPDRLRRGLGLFHAAMIVQDEIVAFTLAMAALEVLAAVERESLLSRLSRGRRRQLRRDLGRLLTDYGIESQGQERLINRLFHTEAVGSAQALWDYLSRHQQDVTDEQLAWWQKQRNAYLHNGAMDDDPTQRGKLTVVVASCLCAELDEHIQEREAPDALSSAPPA
jgi:hypothetical protein